MGNENLNEIESLLTQIQLVDKLAPVFKELIKRIDVLEKQVVKLTKPE